MGEDAPRALANVATVASDDERLARDLQAQEGVVTGQLVGRVVGHGTHGAPIPTSAPSLRRLLRFLDHFSYLGLMPSLSYCGSYL